MKKRKDSMNETELTAEELRALAEETEQKGWSALRWRRRKAKKLLFDAMGYRLELFQRDPLSEDEFKTYRYLSNRYRALLIEDGDYSDAYIFTRFLESCVLQHYPKGICRDVKITEVQLERARIELLQGGYIQAALLYWHASSVYKIAAETEGDPSLLELADVYQLNGMEAAGLAKGTGEEEGMMCQPLRDRLKKKNGGVSHEQQ